jgi:hypothetical protein
MESGAVSKKKEHEDTMIFIHTAFNTYIKGLDLCNSLNRYVPVEVGTHGKSVWEMPLACLCNQKVI